MPYRRDLLTAVLAWALVLVVPGGGATAAATGASEPVYYLPAPAETVLEVSAGNDEPTGRRAGEVYAFDFVAGVGLEPDFTVLAARGGIVVRQRSRVQDGRCRRPADGPRPACWREVNYVLIDHRDGTSGLYLHLEKGEPLVRTGQVVSRGTPLGTAGRSGWTRETGVQFQVQRTPPPEAVGRGGWFLTQSLPIAFSDPSVLEQHPDGVPETGDIVTSANPRTDRTPFRFERRPLDLPAAVPLSSGEVRAITSAYDADSPDGYGLSFAPAEPDAADPGTPVTTEILPVDPGTEVRPLFGGEFVYAGCASGRSADLGLMVVVRRQLDEHDYDAVHGHLTSIEAALLDPLAASPILVDPDQAIGAYGTLGSDTLPESVCPAADGAARDLFVTILEDASVSPEGEISRGVPVSPEPLLGRGGYEGFGWWPGPVRGTLVGEDPGRPRGEWTKRASANGAHISYGVPVTLIARVRDAADLREVRFRAFYPDWARGATADDPAFDPRTTWRLLAVCRPPGASGEPRRTAGCTWDGSARDAIVTYRWDPSIAEGPPAAPWLPRARTAMSQGSAACVPVSLGLEVLDTSGYARAVDEGLPTPTACDDRKAERVDGARVVYLDPLVPPPTPGTRGKVDYRGFPPFEPDPLDGYVQWRDLAQNEDGYKVYAQRNWLNARCQIIDGPYVLIETLPPDTTRYRPRHQRVLRAAPAPEVPNVPGYLTQYEVYVSAFNEAGESKRLFVGGFVGGGEAFCDPGLDEPDIGP